MDMNELKTAIKKDIDDWMRLPRIIKHDAYEKQCDVLQKGHRGIYKPEKVDELFDMYEKECHTATTLLHFLQLVEDNDCDIHF